MTGITHVCINACVRVLCRTCKQMYTLLHCAAIVTTPMHDRRSHSLGHWLNALTNFDTFLMSSNNASTSESLVSVAHFLHHHTSNSSRSYARIQRLVCKQVASCSMQTRACTAEPVLNSKITPDASRSDLDLMLSNGTISSCPCRPACYSLLSSTGTSVLTAK